VFKASPQHSLPLVRRSRLTLCSVDVIYGETFVDTKLVLSCCDDVF